MKLHIESDVAVSANLAAGRTSEVAAVPGCAAGRGGAICTYRVGATRYSRDGRLIAQRSDDGITWSEPQTLLDAPALSPSQSVHAGLPCCMDGDRKFLLFIQTVEARDEATGVFTDGSEHLNHRYWARTSDDAGRSWSEPRPVPLRSPFSPTFLSARPLSLGASQVIIRLVTSTDGGRSWNTSTATQIWDPYQQAAVGTTMPIESDATASQIWAALAGFTFGIPELAPLGNGVALLTYYATLHGILHVRACRLTVSHT